jgi:hypothetical protein
MGDTRGCFVWCHLLVLAQESDSSKSSIEGLVQSIASHRKFKRLAGCVMLRGPYHNATPLAYLKCATPLGAWVLPHCPFHQHIVRVWAW